jgi:hypothetical protein
MINEIKEIEQNIDSEIEKSIAKIVEESEPTDLIKDWIIRNKIYSLKEKEVLELITLFNVSIKEKSDSIRILINKAVK